MGHWDSIHGIQKSIHSKAGSFGLAGMSPPLPRVDGISSQIRDEEGIDYDDHDEMEDYNDTALMVVVVMMAILAMMAVVMVMSASVQHMMSVSLPRASKQPNMT